MIFMRTLLGIVLVACVVALAGLGYRLWQAQRALSERVQALEERQTTSTDAEAAEIRACYERFHQAMLTGNVEAATDSLTPQGRKEVLARAHETVAAYAGPEPWRPILTEIRVEQDTATARRLRIAGKTLIAEPITFRRIDGRWLVEPGPLLRPARQAEPAAGDDSQNADAD